MTRLLLALVMSCALMMSISTGASADTPSPTDDCAVGDMWVTYTPTITPTITPTRTVTPTPTASVTPGGPTLTATLTPTVTATPAPTLTVTPVIGYYWREVDGWHWAGSGRYEIGIDYLSDWAPLCGGGDRIVGQEWCISGYTDGAGGYVQSGVWRTWDYGYFPLTYIPQTAQCQFVRYVPDLSAYLPYASSLDAYPLDPMTLGRWRYKVKLLGTGSELFGGDIEVRQYVACEGEISPTPTPTPTPVPDSGLGGMCVDVDWRATVVATGGRCLTIPTIQPPGVDVTPLPGLDFCYMPAPDMSVLGMDVRMLTSIACVIVALLALGAALRN